MPTATLEPMDPLRVAYDHERLLREPRPDQRNPDAGLPVPLAQTDRLLSIGVFAQRSRLSMKALRRYAEQSDAVADAELRAWRRRATQGL